MGNLCESLGGTDSGTARALARAMKRGREVRDQDRPRSRLLAFCVYELRLGDAGMNRYGTVQTEQNHAAKRHGYKTNLTNHLTKRTKHDWAGTRKHLPNHLPGVMLTTMKTRLSQIFSCLQAVALEIFSFACSLRNLFTKVRYAV